MDQLDFQFIKGRGLNALFEDYLFLFKKIFRHFNKSIINFLLPFLALFLILFFFVSTFGKTIFFDQNIDTPTVILSVSAAVFVLLLFYWLFIFTYGIEYMFLLEEQGATSFSSKEVWRRVQLHIKKYISFFLASIVIGLILLIPIAIIAGILLFIPFIGPLILGILISCLGVVFICGLFLYLKGKEKLFSSYIAAYKLVKKKLLIYGLTTYLFRIMINICLGLITIIPLVLIGIITYNAIGFSEEIFTTFLGKILVSIGGTILILFSVISTIYSVTFYTLIYFSSLETTRSEATLNQINQIGQTDDEME